MFPGEKTADWPYYNSNQQWHFRIGYTVRKKKKKSHWQHRDMSRTETIQKITALFSANHEHFHSRNAWFSKTGFAWTYSVDVNCCMKLACSKYLCSHYLPSLSIYKCQWRRITHEFSTFWGVFFFSWVDWDIGFVLFGFSSSQKLSLVGDILKYRLSGRRKTWLSIIR